MREILFRGKRIDNGEWVEGWLTEDTIIGNKTYVAPVIHIKDSRLFATEWHEIDPDTVGEYTGLKDKNGKMIFEGDILKIAKTMNGVGYYYIPPLDYPVNVVVKWDLCSWMWETLCEDKRYIGFPDAWCYYEAEVIGNIHDNPELMGGAK